MKICIRENCIYAGIPQEVNNFHGNGSGRRMAECKSCRSKTKKEYYNLNRERIIKKGTEYQKKRPKYKKYHEIYNKFYYKKHRKEIIEKSKTEEGRKRAKNNSMNRTKNGKAALDQRIKYAQDINYRLASIGRSRRRIALKLQNAKKQVGFNESIGCTIDFFRQHIESKFLLGMTWENYGEWQIDEIKPCAAFNLSDPKQYKECFNYRNTQPLWAIDNMKKNSIYNGVNYRKRKAA